MRQQTLECLAFLLGGCCTRDQFGQPFAADPAEVTDCRDGIPRLVNRELQLDGARLRRHDDPVFAKRGPRRSFITLRIAFLLADPAGSYPVLASAHLA
jgi:hypothetical protein